MSLPSRGGIVAAFFAVGYPVLFEGLPDDWQVAGLPLRSEAILLALAIAAGRWGILGIVVGAAALRITGIDGLPWAFAVVEGITFAVGLGASRWVWVRVGAGWNALAATGVLTGAIVVGLGTYWTLMTGRFMYDVLFLQSFLAINVIGVLSLLAVARWGQLFEDRRPVVAS